MTEESRYPALQEAYGANMAPHVGNVATAPLIDTSLIGEPSAYTVWADRLWTTYPVPDGLWSASGDSFVVMPEGQGRATKLKEGESRFVVAYSSLDYRLRAAASRARDRYAGVAEVAGSDDTDKQQAARLVSEQYAGLAKRLDGMRRFSTAVRRFGNAGGKTESGIREIIAGHMENVGDYGHRWFIVFRRKLHGKTVLDVDYFCLEKVSKQTYDAYKENLALSPDEADERLISGKAEGEDKGESGRGILLIAALAVPGTADIEWLDSTEYGDDYSIGSTDGEDRTEEATGERDDEDESRWTHVWFTMDGSKVKENPLVANLPDKALVGAFDKDVDLDILLAKLELPAEVLEEIERYADNLDEDA